MNLFKKLKIKKSSNNSNSSNIWKDEEIEIVLPEPKVRKKMSFPLKLLLISLAIFLFSMVFLAFSLVNKNTSFSENKILTVAEYSATVTSGEYSRVSVTITNNNKIPLSEAYLMVTYDSGESFSGDKNIVKEKINIGEVLPLSAYEAEFDILVFGAEGIIKEIDSMLYYKIPQTNAEFNKKINTISLALKTSPVSINVTNLKEIHKDHELEFEIVVKNNTRETIKDLIISARNPNDFLYMYSSEDLHTNTPSWIIKELPVNASKKIKMVGKLIGDIGDYSNFTFYAGVLRQNSKDNTEDDSNQDNSLANFDNFNNIINNVYSKIEKKVLITGQYLDIAMFENSFEKTSFTAGENIQIQLQYKNNIDFPLDDVVVTARLVGEAINFEGIYPVNGIFDRETNTVIWDKSTYYTFSQIPSKASGDLYFTFTLKNDILKESDIFMTVYAEAERNAEYGVSNVQDISIKEAWLVKPQEFN